MNNPKISVALASLRAILKRGLLLTFSPMNAHSQPAVTAWCCVLQTILLPKTMHAANASVLLRILNEGKLKHARFKRATQSIATEIQHPNYLL